MTIEKTNPLDIYFIKKYIGERAASLSTPQLVIEVVKTLCPSFLPYIATEESIVLFTNYLKLPHKIPSYPAFTVTQIPDCYCALAHAIQLVLSNSKAQVFFYYHNTDVISNEIDSDLIACFGDRFKARMVSDASGFKEDIPFMNFECVYYCYTSSLLAYKSIPSIAGRGASKVINQHFMNKDYQIDDEEFFRRADAFCFDNFSPLRRTGLTSKRLIKAIFLAITNPTKKVAFGVGNEDRKKIVFSMFSSVPKPKNLAIINLFKSDSFRGNNFEYVVLDCDDHMAYMEYYVKRYSKDLCVPESKFFF